jgi:predicted nucleic acid-binding protein
MIAVSDAGPLIHLSWIGQLNVLQALFGEVVIPPSVEDEVFGWRTDARGLPGLRAARAEGWLRVERTQNENGGVLFGLGLQRGETDAIALTEEFDAEILLSDDMAAREIARQRGLDVTGTLGVLVRARQRGLGAAVHPLAIELKRMGFWLSEGLIDETRRADQGH